MADVHDKLIGNWTDAAKVCRDEERGAGGGSWTARWSVGGGVRAAGSVTLQSPPGSAVLYSNLEGINCRDYTYRDLALPLGSILLCLVATVLYWCAGRGLRRRVHVVSSIE